LFKEILVRVKKDFHLEISSVQRRREARWAVDIYGNKDKYG
jgi:hypothetical protein